MIFVELAVHFLLLHKPLRAPSAQYRLEHDDYLKADVIQQALIFRTLFA